MTTESHTGIVRIARNHRLSYADLTRRTMAGGWVTVLQALRWAALGAFLAGRVAWAVSPVPGVDQPRPVAIVGATIHPVSAPPIESGKLLFQHGRVVALGAEVALPDDTVQVDASGRHVYPGLMNAVGELGLVEINSIRASRDASETGSLNPNVRAQVAVNPDSELIPVTRANGVLLVLSSPSGGLVAGTSAVLQLDGWTWEDLTLKAPAAMHVAWPGMRARRGESDDPLQELKQLFDEAERYRVAENRTSIDVRLEAMVPVLEGKVPLLVDADTRRQIQSAVAFAAQRKVKLIVRGGYDAEQCAALLKEYDVPVIIPAVYRLPRRRSDPFDAAYTLPARLHAAGVRYCIAGGDRFAASNLRNLPYHAATAAAYGLSQDEAIKAITLYPAQILAVADRVGSLEPGKDATLIVTDGSPLETSTQVLMAYVQGRRVDLSNRHQELADKYHEKYRRWEAASQPPSADAPPGD